MDAGNFPKLAALMSHVLDYRNRFLEGSNQPGINLEAGLPNIVGMVGNWNDSFGTK